MQIRPILLAIVLASCGEVAAMQSQPDASATDSGTADTPEVPVRSAVALGNTNAFTIPSQVFTKVLYTAKAYDTLSEYDAAQNRFTAKLAADYDVCASLNAGSALPIELDVFINGSRLGAIGGGTGTVTGCRAVPLAAGDSLEIWAWQTSGSNATVTADADWNWLTLHQTSTLVSIDGIASYSATLGGYTTVPYSGEQLDSRNEFDPALNHFTASQAGDYRLCGSLGTESTRGYLRPFVNGVDTSSIAGTSAMSYPTIGGCNVIQLASGDVVDLRYYHGAPGSTVTLANDPWWDWLTIQQVTLDLAVSGTSTFAVPDQTFTTVPFSTVAFDSHSSYDPSGVFTAPAAGDYEVCASLIESASATFELDLFLNGQREKAFGFSDHITSGCRTARITAGTTVSVRAYQASGSTVTFMSDARWDWLAIRRLP